MSPNFRWIGVGSTYKIEHIANPVHNSYLQIKPPADKPYASHLNLNHNMRLMKNRIRNIHHLFQSSERSMPTTENPNLASRRGLNQAKGIVPWTTCIHVKLVSSRMLEVESPSFKQNGNLGMTWGFSLDSISLAGEFGLWEISPLLECWKRVLFLY